MYISVNFKKGKAMKKVLLASMVGLLASTGVFAQEPQGYVQSQSGPVKSGTGLCWLSLGDKVPDERCGDKLEQPVKAPAVVQPATIVPAPVVVEKRAVNVQVDLDVLFRFDSSKLTDESMKTLREWAAKYQIQKVRIVGHADQFGPVRYNETLSLKRANVVKNYLTSVGVPESAFESVTGVGKTDPVVNCNPMTIKCEAPNRRVQIQGNVVER